MSASSRAREEKVKPVTITMAEGKILDKNLEKIQRTVPMYFHKVNPDNKPIRGKR